MLTTLRETWAYPACATLCVALVAALGVAWCRLRAQRMQTDRERHGREELEAYARLDLRVSSYGDLKSLPRRVCAVVAARSSFQRIAMLMYAPGGRLCVAAHEGMDFATIEFLETLLEDHQPPTEAIEYWDDAAQVRLGLHSGVMRLKSLKSGDRPGGMAVLVPIRAGNRKIAALLVCADNILDVPQRRADEAVIGLEALATRLGHALEEIPSSLQPLSWASDLDAERYLHEDPLSIEMSSSGERRQEFRIV